MNPLHVEEGNPFVRSTVYLTPEASDGLLEVRVDRVSRERKIYTTGFHTVLFGLEQAAELIVNGKPYLLAAGMAAFLPENSRYVLGGRKSDTGLQTRASAQVLVMGLRGIQLRDNLRFISPKSFSGTPFEAPGGSTFAEYFGADQTHGMLAFGIGTHPERYPESGYAYNTRSTEVVFYLAGPFGGPSTVLLPSSLPGYEHQSLPLHTRSLVVIPAATPYAIERTHAESSDPLKLAVLTAPGWTPDQHRLVSLPR